MYFVPCYCPSTQHGAWHRLSAQLIFDQGKLHFQYQDFKEIVFRMYTSLIYINSFPKKGIIYLVLSKFGHISSITNLFPSSEGAWSLREHLQSWGRPRFLVVPATLKSWPTALIPSAPEAGCSLCCLFIQKYFRKKSFLNGVNPFRLPRLSIKRHLIAQNQLSTF